MTELTPLIQGSLDYDELSAIYNGDHPSYVATGPAHYALGAYLIDRLESKLG